VTSFKIALRNVKKSFRDYAIYFLTLTLGVCVFYVFNSIDSQQAVMNLTAGQTLALRTLDRLMGGFSVFISCVLGFLIIYANNFLIKRRKKEFGVYLILGMERGKISRILVFETVAVGLFALFAGIVLGIFSSQGMAVITASLLGAEISGLKFVFSLSALSDALFYFGLTFILILIFNVVTVWKQKLIDLLYADAKNQRFREPRLTRSVCLFILSLICIGAAYVIVTCGGLAALSGMLPLILGLGAAGTFLFFFSLSGFLLKLLKQNKKLYLRGLNMFVLRQINSKINTAYVSITFVCLMLFLSICALSTGMGMANAISADIRGSAPFDVSFTVDLDYRSLGGGTEIAYPGVDLALAVSENSVNIDSFAKEYIALRCYDAGVRIPLEVSGEIRGIKTRFIKLSDYNALLSMQGIQPIALGADEFAVNFNRASYLPETIASYMSGRPEIKLGDAILRAEPSLFRHYALGNATDWTSEPTLIVNGALLNGFPAVSDALHINYLDSSGEGSPEALRKKFLAGISLPEENGVRLRTTVTTKAELLETSNSTTTTVAYLAVYLGVVFLISSATVLAIAQLSEASDNIRRYGLLRKLGAEDKMTRGALTAQISIYFGAPLILALAHSFVGINMAGGIISSIGDMDILGSSLFTAAVILLIYGGYFLATCQGAKNMLRTRE
jgi:putative ABC transport system permease protein